MNLDSVSTSSSSSQGLVKLSTAGSAPKLNSMAPPPATASQTGKGAVSVEEEEEDSIDLRKTELVEASQVGDEGESS